MGRAKPVEIDTRRFRTQTEATEFFGGILRQYKPGERVREEHEPDLRALLKRHTEYPEKLGTGVAYFFVDVPGDREYKAKLRDPGQCFWIYRTDGTKGRFFDRKLCHATKARLAQLIAYYRGSARRICRCTPSRGFLMSVQRLAGRFSFQPGVGWESDRDSSSLIVCDR
jgi:hypothetical protein